MNILLWTETHYTSIIVEVLAMASAVVRAGLLVGIMLIHCGICCFPFLTGLFATRKQGILYLGSCDSRFDLRDRFTAHGHTDASPVQLTGGWVVATLMFIEHSMEQTMEHTTVAARVHDLQGPLR